MWFVASKIPSILNFLSVFHHFCFPSSFHGVSYMYFHFYIILVILPISLLSFCSSIHVRFSFISSSPLSLSLLFSQSTLYFSPLLSFFSPLPSSVLPCLELTKWRMRKQTRLSPLKLAERFLPFTFFMTCPAGCWWVCSTPSHLKNSIKTGR